MSFVAPIAPVWPTEIWDGESLVAPSGTTWCAVKVGPRCEKQVVRELAGRTAAYFLGLAVSTKIYQRRKIETQTPLFPGYVFAAGTEEQLSSLWRLRNVSATLTPPSQGQFVRELSDIYRLMMSGAPLTPEEKLQPGEWARIKSGGLRGVEGTILKNLGGMRLIIEVKWLGQGVSVEVTPDMLERVHTVSSQRQASGATGHPVITAGRTSA